jgi:hypothetical protein
MNIPGMFSRQPTVTDYRVPMHPDEAAGFADATAFLNVRQHGKSLFVRQRRTKQRCPLALGKSSFAGPTTEYAPLLLRSIAITYREISAPALAVVRTPGILTTKPREIIHDQPSLA